jgi:hypothetical protein
MAAFITRTEGVSVSYHYVAKLWRDNGLAPRQQGTFKISTDPEFAEKSPISSGCTWLLPVAPWSSRLTSWVGPGRVDVLTDVTFPRPARRTGRAHS